MEMAPQTHEASGLPSQLWPLSLGSVPRAAWWRGWAWVLAAVQMSGWGVLSPQSVGGGERPAEGSEAHE